MNWLVAVIVGIFGAALADEWGVLLGAALGYLLSHSIRLSTRLQILERKVQLLEAEQTSATDNNQVVDKTPQAIKASSATPVLHKMQAQVVQAPSITTTKITQPNEALDLDLPEEDLKTQNIENKNKVDESSIGATTSLQTTPLDKGLEWLKRYFTEGNVIVRIGLVVLFFGLSFLVKYSIDNALLPIEIRVIAIACMAVGLLIFGWKKRLSKPGFGLALQGGGVAVLYLVTFAAFSLYHLISAGIAFPLLVTFSVLGMVLAVVQNAKALAVSAILGGFASPILASSGGGSHVALFSYYLILNLAIFGVAWFKSWRLLNVVGFAFTFLVGAIWGVTQYSHENFLSTEPFLIIFFLLYVAISLLFATKQPTNLKGYVDGTLVFGVPLVGFGLQAALVYKYEYGLAYSALALGVFYAAIVSVIRKLRIDHLQVLAQAMQALAVIFLSLTIAFALDSRLTAATWAIEGAAFIWLGLKQQRVLVKYFGVLLQGLGALLFLADMPYAQNGLLFLNTQYLGCFTVSIAAVFSAYCFDQNKNSNKPLIPFNQLFLAAGLLWWYIGGGAQISDYFYRTYEISAFVLFFTVSAAIWACVALRLKWTLLAYYPWLLIMPLYYLAFAACEQTVFLANYGYFVWPVAIAMCFGILWFSEKNNYCLVSVKKLHMASFILLVGVSAISATTEAIAYQLGQYWEALVFILPVIIALFAIHYWRKWPIISAPKVYELHVACLLIAVFFLWSFVANIFMFLKIPSWSYIPLMNPMDAVQVIGLIAVFIWCKNIPQKWLPNINKKIIWALFSGFGFVWFNALLFKTISTITGISYNAGVLFESSIVQMAVSITWSLIGLATMVIASKIQLRNLWIVGAALAGIVVAKLFLLDLSERETVERIVSFLVVGFLLLIVGYFSPVPPGRQDKEPNNA